MLLPETLLEFCTRLYKFGDMSLETSSDTLDAMQVEEEAGVSTRDYT